MRAITIIAFLAAGCGEKDGTDSEDLPPIGGGDDDTAECEGTDPEARGLELANGGVQDFDGTLSPTIEVRIDGYDADGNLDYVTMEVWFEAADDGSVDTSGDADVRSTFTVEDTPCEVTESDLVLRVQVGGGLAYNTNYDVGARFIDSSGATSNVVEATGSTPREDGEDGDGSGP